MNFRNFADLEHAIASHLHQIPFDVDLVVGVPRSGLLAAVPIALHLNLPMVDLDGAVERRSFSGGRRLGIRADHNPVDSARKILVVDDSLISGRSIREARQKMEDAGLAEKTIFAAVYVHDTELASHNLDIWFECVPRPRIFAWNLMNSYILKKACVDIDGVLCRDPTPDENDDSERYLKFLSEATPLFLPRVPIGTLVTSRLERYRDATVEWLTRHGVEYDKLEMLDLPNKEARQRLRASAPFKAETYRITQGAEIFIESDPVQARDIANLSRRPVICIESQRFVEPDLKSLAEGILSKAPSAIVRRGGHLKRVVKECLLKLNRW